MTQRRGAARASRVAPRGLALLAAAALAGCGRCDGSAPLRSSRAYKGHANDADMNRLVSAWPAVIGTRLDDCQTCHRGGSFTIRGRGGSRTITRNACDFCHLIKHPEAAYAEPQPRSAAETLNPFGRDYAVAGRSLAALARVADRDSDGDGATNAAELAALKYPGDRRSKPGQPVAPMKVFTLAQLRALPATTELLLSNATQEDHDAYASYTGVKLKDLLTAAGVDLARPGITGITVIAPDGYLKDVALEALLAPFPPGLFFDGLDTRRKGSACGFVSYPRALPAGLVDGGSIPGAPWVILAYARDGAPLVPTRLDVKAGKIEGEGPLRLVVPQRRPGPPDRGSKRSPTRCGDGHDFDPQRDHNAGEMVRGVVGIRVNPLPAGYEDFDYHNGGWSFVDAGRVFVYGFGVGR